MGKFFGMTKEEALEAEMLQGPVPRPVVPGDPYDLTVVQASLEPYMEKLNDLSIQAKGVEIKDEESQVQAVEMTGQIKWLEKNIEDARKEFVAKPNDYVKRVNALAKSITAKVQEIQSGLKRKISDYQIRLEMERRKAEEAARKEAMELQKRLDAEAKAANVAPVQIEPPVVQKAQTKVVTSAGTAYQHKEWRFEVEEDAKVPREYLVVDQRLIREAVKAGVREIPGVKIFEHTETRVRR